MRIDPHQGISGEFSYQTLGPENSYKLSERENWFHSKHYKSEWLQTFKATLESRTLEPCLQNDFQLRILYVQSNYQV